MAAVTTTLSSLDLAINPPHTKESVTPNSSCQINGYTGSSGIRKSTSLKLHHVAAVHSKNRTSCLSHDSAETPSFLGFRNLMVIVLSTYLSRNRLRSPQNIVLMSTVVMNLRLVIENFQKVHNHIIGPSMQQAKNHVSMAFSSASAVMITVATTFSSASSSSPSSPVIRS